MYKILIFVFTFFHLSVYAKQDAIYNIDCIRLSGSEYLIQIKNNTNQAIFLPEEPRVSFQGDSMYANISLPYKSNSCTFYIYSIAGKRIITAQALSSMSPDSVYTKHYGVMPNFAVPSPLVELKPNESYYFNIFGDNCVNPRILALEIEIINLNTQVKEREIITTTINDGL